MITSKSIRSLLQGPFLKRLPIHVLLSLMACFGLQACFLLREPVEESVPVSRQEDPTQAYKEQIAFLTSRLDSIENAHLIWEVSGDSTQDCRTQLAKCARSHRAQKSRLRYQNKIIDSLVRVNKGHKAELKKEQLKTQKVEASLQEVMQKVSDQALHLERLDNSFDIYLAEPEKRNIRLYWKDHRNKRFQNFENLRNAYTEGQLVFATNGGMYKKDGAPQGLYIEGGEELIPLDPKEKGYGNFYMQPNGIFVLDTAGKAEVISTQQFMRKYGYKGRGKSPQLREIQFATQSGPMLVHNGKINEHFRQGSSNLNIRSGVGIMKNQKVVFAISNKRVNFYDFAAFFKSYLGCDNALYLDGAISEMYVPELKRYQKGGNYGAIIGIVE